MRALGSRPSSRLGGLARSDLLLAAGAVFLAVGTAEAAWTVGRRFGDELLGLAPLERAAVALWDFRPLVLLPAAAGGLLLAAALAGEPGRLAARREGARRVLLVLAAAHAAFAVVVIALAAWVAGVGELAGGELGYYYSPGERALTAATQALAYLPLLALFLALALRAAEPAGAPVEAPEAEPIRAGVPLSEELEPLWREHLAFGPRRERARVLLARLRALEAAGDHEGARSLAEELRRLGP